MPVLSRTRTVALALAVAAGPLLAPGVAMAASPTVTFNGNCAIGGLGASSQPDVGAISVPAGTTVMFVNHLQKTAKLLVNGQERAKVEPDFQIGVAFQGPASVSMAPTCLLGSGSVGSVEVAVASESAGPSGPVPSGGGSPSRGRASSRPSASSSRTPGQPSATPSGATPSASDDPSGGLGLADPSGAPSDPAVAVGAATPAVPGRHGPAGLLALIATVCVIGVSIAFIRAIIAQRAIRMVAA